MKARQKFPTGMLLFGVVAFLGGAFYLWRAWVAEQQHSFVPYRSGGISPLQAYFAGGMAVAIGVFVIARWMLHQQPK